MRSVDTLESYLRTPGVEMERYEPSPGRGNLVLRIEGTVDRQAGVTRFTEIVISPRLTFAPGVDRAKVAAVVARAEKACLVSATLAIPVRVEAAVVENEAAA